MLTRVQKSVSYDEARSCVETIRRTTTGDLPYILTRKNPDKGLRLLEDLKISVFDKAGKQHAPTRLKSSKNLDA